jgi:hypothetical protein
MYVYALIIFGIIYLLFVIYKQKENGHIISQVFVHWIPCIIATKQLYDH